MHECVVVREMKAAPQLRQSDPPVSRVPPVSPGLAYGPASFAHQPALHRLWLCCCDRYTNPEAVGGAKTALSKVDL
uniref:Uncharacterized protein n=1 Tax=Panagrellus redivivus TaxID=6233 RepID=A0A7E4ZVX3_PANRE